MVCFPASLLRLARCLLCSLCVGGWTAQKGGRAARQKRACAWIQSNNAFLRSSQLRNVPLSPAVGCVGVTGYRYAFRLHHGACDCAVRGAVPVLSPVRDTRTAPTPHVSIVTMRLTSVRFARAARRSCSEKSQR